MFSKKGFTLIEVLVVVLIVGILVGIGTREYRRSVHRAEAAEASMLIAAVRDAMDDYGTEFGSCPTGNWMVPGMAHEALEFYNYTATGCTVVITPKSTRGLNVSLTVSASSDGLPQSLTCTGEDCDVFSPFGCGTEGENGTQNTICDSFI